MGFEIEDQVIRDPAVKDYDSYRVFLNGKLLPHSWNSKGAAEAGLIVERERAAKRATNGTP